MAVSSKTEELVNLPVGLCVERNDDVELFVELIDLVFVELALDLVSAKGALLSASAISHFLVSFDAEQIAHL